MLRKKKIKCRTFQGQKVMQLSQDYNSRTNHRKKKPKGVQFQGYQKGKVWRKMCNGIRVAER